MLDLVQDKHVLIVTQDGRTILVRRRHSSKGVQKASSSYPTYVQGDLKGFDQTTNIILAESIERVFSMDDPVEEVPLGLYVVRGDNMYVPFPDEPTRSPVLTSVPALSLARLTRSSTRSLIGQGCARTRLKKPVHDGTTPLGP